MKCLLVTPNIYRVPFLLLPSLLSFSTPMNSVYSPFYIGIIYPNTKLMRSVQTFLSLLADSLLSINLEEVNKPLVTNLFNLSIPGVYWVSQNLYMTRSELNFCYCFISENQVLIGEEVEDYVQTLPSSNNCEFHYVVIYQTRGYFRYKVI